MFRIRKDESSPTLLALRSRWPLAWCYRRNTPCSKRTLVQYIWQARLHSCMLFLQAMAGRRSSLCSEPQELSSTFAERARIIEARDLASAAVMASILVVLIAVTESRAPTLVRHALACNAPDAQSRVAATEVPPAGPRLAFNSRPVIERVTRHPWESEREPGSLMYRRTLAPHRERVVRVELRRHL